jgi:hypothetical protein
LEIMVQKPYNIFNMHVETDISTSKPWWEIARGNNQPIRGKNYKRWKGKQVVKIAKTTIENWSSIKKY